MQVTQEHKERSGAPRRERGRMRAADRPGLGIEPRLDVLGEPVLDISA